VASWQNGKLAKWQVGKMASWLKGVALFYSKFGIFKKLI
jgi:hypothetical protein